MLFPKALLPPFSQIRNFVEEFKKGMEFGFFYFYEEEADKYFQTHDQIGDIEKQINLFIDRVPGKKVLDIGCGPGRDSKYLSNHNLDVTGIDLTKKFVEIDGNKNLILDIIKLFFLLEIIMILLIRINKYINI